MLLLAVLGGVGAMVVGPMTVPAGSGREHGAAADCLRVIAPIAAGAPLRRGDFEAAPCRDPASRPVRYGSVRYDRANGIARARRGLLPGEVLAPLPDFALTDVARGQPVTVVITIGAVTVARSAVAVQPARAGGRLFVQAADGAVFATSYPGQQR